MTITWNNTEWRREETEGREEQREASHSQFPWTLAWAFPAVPNVPVARQDSEHSFDPDTVLLKTAQYDSRY